MDRGGDIGRMVRSLAPIMREHTRSQNPAASTGAINWVQAVDSPSGPVFACRS
jgi:hypothetical protein